MHKVKILSYIKNMNKLLYVCPFCYTSNSMILNSEELDFTQHKCAQCRKEYDMDISALGRSEEQS